MRRQRGEGIGKEKASDEEKGSADEKGDSGSKKRARHGRSKKKNMKENSEGGGG